MSGGTQTIANLLEKQIQAQRRVSVRGAKWLEEKHKYTTDETAMEIVSSYSRFYSPFKPLQLRGFMHSGKAATQQVGKQEVQLLVYDSHAKMTVQANEQLKSPSIPARRLTQAQRRDLKHISAFEATIFESVPDYPPMKPAREDYSLLIPTHHCLRFNSKFESGNLRKVFKVSDSEYHLLLECDTETRTHMQWYYFSAHNQSAGQTVTFCVLNLSKRVSLYSKGLRPLVYSVTNSAKNGVGWHREGTGVRFEPSPWGEENGEVKHSMLSFKYTFEFPEDTVYFAHCYPYTFTDLCRELKSFVSLNSILRIDTLCETIAHNSCPVLTITDQIETYTPWACDLSNIHKSAAGRKMIRMKEARMQKNEEDPAHRSKKGVVLMARVHPGETCGSLMLKGALELLLSDCREAKLLRRHFVFRIVPMLNPDGVVYGNTRTSLIGVDLNRRWVSPSSMLHPTLYYTKRLVQVMSEEREVALVCDLHGHSVKRRVFMYGCKHSSYELRDRRSNAMIRLLPMLLSRRCELFSFKNCHFGIDKSKEATSRVVFFRELKIERSYTMEASFYGPLTDGVSHMQEEHYAQVGRELCKQLLVFVNKRLFRKKVQDLVQHVQRIRSKIWQQAQAVQDTDADLALLEGSNEQFTEQEAISELGEFEEALNATSESEESDGTESSDSSDDERKADYIHSLQRTAEKSQKVSVRRLERPPKAPQLRGIQKQKTPTKMHTSLSRRHSPIDAATPEQLTSESLSFSKLKDVPSKYLQFLLNPPPRPKLSQNVSFEEPAAQLSAVSIRNDQLHQTEAPNARVIIARSAGAFRSAIKTKEHQLIFRPDTAVERRGVRISRIHSTLCVGKKTVWMCEAAKPSLAKRIAGLRGEEVRSDESRLEQSEVLGNKGSSSLFHPLKTVS